MTTKRPLLLSYVACGTCKKALAWLASRNVEVTVRSVTDAPPTPEELQRWIPESGVPVRKWLNTSGLSYRSIGKDAWAGETDATLIRRLAGDGKLVKRPVLVHRGKVLVGFREEAYEALFGGTA